MHSKPMALRSIGRCSLLTLMGVVSGCGKPPTAGPLPTPTVTVSLPVQGEVVDAIEYTGNTAALESVQIRAMVKGYLKSIHFKPRDRVKAGALLFVIDPRPYQVALDKATAELAARKANLDKAEFTAAKTSRLYKEDAAAEDEKVDSQAAMDAARAAIGMAEAAIADARLNLEYCHVTAPINGRISRNMIDAGNLIEPGTSMLATLVNDEDVYVYYDVSEADVLRLKRTASTRGRYTATQIVYPAAYLGLMDETGYPHQGVLDYFAPELDRSTGTIQVRGRFPNSDGHLLAGLFARIRVPISKPTRALMVDERALGLDQGQRYLLVVNDQNVVEYRRVRVGILRDGLRAIEEGIRPTDWVIVNGLLRVRPRMTVVPQRAPMPVAVGPASRPAGPSTSSPVQSRPRG
jgi:membrane fusion protein, multidrug efflux system